MECRRYIERENILLRKLLLEKTERVAQLEEENEELREIVRDVNTKLASCLIELSACDLSRNN